MGISCDARGWRLALRLLASGSLLAALRLYRFGFVLGMLRVRMQRISCGKKLLVFAQAKAGWCCTDGACWRDKNTQDLPNCWTSFLHKHLLT